MIDYEKLKIAHELAEKLSQQEPFVSFCYDFFYCKKEGNKFQVKLLLGCETKGFESGYYDMRNLDDLIAKLQELTQPEPECQHDFIPFPGALGLSNCKKCGESVFKNECQHESDGNLYHVNGLYVVSIDETDPPFTASEKYKCKKCGEFYR